MNRFQFIRRFLIDDIQPIMVEEVGVAAPCEVRFLGIVVARVIVLGDGDGQAFFLIPQVLFFEGPAVVFEVAEDEEAAVVRRTDDVDAVFGGPRQDFQFRRVVDGNVIYGRMAGLGNEVAVIEAPKQRMVLLSQLVFKDTEELGRQIPFVDAVVVVEPGLGAPAEEERRKGMGLGPVEIGLHFRPVVDGFKGNLFDRRAGNDQAVIVAVLNVFEDVVVFIEIRGIGMGTLMHFSMAEVDFDLERRVTEQAQELQLRGLL